MENLEIYLDYIGEDGYVYRYNYDSKKYYNTGICLKGSPGNPGRPGKDGKTPHIGTNGNWFIGNIDTGVRASGGGSSGSQVQSDWNQTDNTADDFIKNKPTIPTVPTNVSAFTNDAGYLTQHQDISGKQDTLVSGTNIKTINNESLLGGGNISVVAELPSNLTYTSNDSGVGIVPEDGIRAVTVTSAAAMTINPDVVTVIDGAVGTAAITLQVPQDNLAHVWDILLTTDSTVAITFAMSNSAIILTPSGFSIGASKAVEISVIGVGTKYYLRYGEFA